MPIRSFTPKISVVLRKVQHREGSSRVAHLNAKKIPFIDLTPFLGETGGVTTTAGVDQAAGTFAITLADKMDAKSLDSLYGSLEPMDLVEIRMARTPKGAVWPIVMRGFVSHVERVETIGNDGRPVRSLQVVGHNFGKLLQITQINYKVQYAYRNFLMTKAPLFEAYGDIFYGPASLFMARVLDEFVELRFIKDLCKASALENKPIFAVEATVMGTRIGPYGIPPFEGNIWKMLTDWADLDWNELFVEDREDASYLIYRPKPYYALDAEWELPTDTLVLAAAGAKPPDEIAVMDDEVVAMNVARTDQNVANFFLCDAPVAEMVNQDGIKQHALSNLVPLDDRHANNLPELYGIKILTGRTNQYIDDGSPGNISPSLEQKHQMANSMGAWYRMRIEQLKAMYRDNVVLEEGTLTMRRNEAIKPGMYIRLHRGTLASRYYVTHVTQQFHPFQPFKTTLQLSRGEGYIDRINANNANYVGEKGKGAYG